ncbi:efflux RND transporter periplasmic adaptor subunit [Roseobacter weihaiensis]|uniref:efflux RND transporter periplasmic adaptor subunit n=1 Tax=Roseobacter weihaiensis TaxID=2763262 RepID=UPI001D09CE6D|nr:efflux RND transporter periplasmic adaptor subunit [Roseobacter sp. H9]
MADVETAGSAKRVKTLVLQASATLLTIGIAVAVLVIGVGFLNDRAAAVPEPDPAPALPVSVETLRMEDSYTLPRRFIGQIEARATVSLSFELGGRIDALLVEEGDTVTAGQEIARLDIDLLEADRRRLEASRAASKAQLVSAESRLARAMQLQKQGFTSQETLDQALAARDELSNRIAETDAALDTVAINIEKSVLFAPFDGQIAAQNVDAAETIQAGQEIVTVMETSAPEFRVGLPLDVSAEALARVQIDVAGQALPATLKRIRPDIDPVTRTRTALFSLDIERDVVFGQTASLVMRSTVAAQGAWVPADALQSGEGSVWTVMIVVEDKLYPAAVEILHLEDERAFVTGSFDADAQIVTSGAHRIVGGQTVTIVGTEG